MNEPELLYCEDAVAEKLKISRDDLQYIRTNNLEKEGGHWRQTGKKIVLTQAGLDATIEHLNCDTSGVDFTTCLLGHSTIVDLVVTGLCPNKRFLKARPAVGQRDVMVRVKSNVNFRAKMKIKARQPAESAEQSFYELEGRCPRYPGRW